MLANRSHAVASLTLRTCAIACAIGAVLIGAPATARAQTTTVIGSLANFDAVNDTEGEKQGFEIELEGIQVNDITRIFGGSGSQCYIRYCMGSITPYGDQATGKSGVRVRWQANYDAATQQYIVPASSALSGKGTSGTPSRLGMVNPPRLVSGEQCWTFGLAAGYAGSGCEHFGISTAFGKNPTGVTYRWLAADPADPTQLIAATTKVLPPGANAYVYVQAPPVAIPHPVVLQAVLNKGVVVQLDVAIPAMPVVPDPPLPGVPPPPIPHRYGKAQWVKVSKTELDRDADLDELVGGHPNHVIEAAEAAAAETEWKLLQLDVTNPDKGGSRLQSGGKHDGRRAVVRRYEFYKYSGPVVQDGIRADKQKVPYLANDQEASLLCTRATPGDPTTECVAPPQVLDPANYKDTDYIDPKTLIHYAEVGDYIGAQMAAQNLVVDARLIPAIDWGPAAIGYGTALGNGQLNGSASATGVPSVPGTFMYTPALGTVLPAGVHTLQVVFTPTDATKFTTQSMIRQITVNKATLTVKANAQAKVYGAIDPPFTFSATGFINGDTEATALSGGLDREIGSDVGKYAINIGTLKTSGNYTGSFTGALLEITRAPLSITASDASKAYGQTTTFAGTEFTVGVGHLQDVDTVASVTLTSDGAAAGGAAGPHAIVASAAVGGGLTKLTNYNITYSAGTLTVTKADVTVSTSGGAFAYDGLAHGSTGAANVAGSFSYAYTPGGASAPVDAAAAPYGVTATFTPTDAANYNVGTATNAITISKVDATITVVGFIGPYDGAAHGATGSAVGVALEDLSALLTLGGSFTDAPGGTATWNFAGDTNYNPATGTATITIAPPPPPPPPPPQPPPPPPPPSTGRHEDDDKIGGHDDDRQGGRDDDKQDGRKGDRRSERRSKGDREDDGRTKDGKG